MCPGASLAQTLVDVLRRHAKSWYTDLVEDRLDELIWLLSRMQGDALQCLNQEYVTLNETSYFHWKLPFDLQLVEQRRGHHSSGSSSAHARNAIQYTTKYWRLNTFKFIFRQFGTLRELLKKIRPKLNSMKQNSRCVCSLLRIVIRRNWQTKNWHVLCVPNWKTCNELDEAVGR